MSCQKVITSFLLILISVFLLCSCQSVSQLTEVNSTALKNEIEETEEADKTISPEISNPYFAAKAEDEIDFKGVAWFDSFGDVPIPKYKTKIHFIEIAKLKNGVLYQLKVDQMSDYEIPEERLSLGYFYVQEDKIIRIWEDEDYEAEGNVWTISQEALKDLEDNDRIPQYSTVVCQEDEIKDVLDEDELGWHQYLRDDGERRYYGGWYQHPQHSGYWETFIWEKGTGLVYYQSGYRDGVNYIELTRTASPDHSTYYDKITDALADYDFQEEVASLDFAPYEEIDTFFEEKQIFLDEITEISIVQADLCQIINEDAKDLILQIYVEGKMNSHTWLMPFLYDGTAFHLNGDAVVAYSGDACNYRLQDLDGDGQNEILTEYRQVHNGTNHILQIMKCDSYESAKELFYHSVDDFTHNLDYEITDDVPAQFRLIDTKTYINTDKKEKVAKKTQYTYVLRKGEYRIKNKKILEKSDRKDFYDWTLG